MKPTVSIVTLSFNQAKFLPKCLESIHGQLAEGDEHICVDPGSTDGSREILGDLVDPRQQRVFEADSGPADGLNRGFAVARGEILAFINADDELAPGALDFAREFFGTAQDTDILLGAIRVIDGAGHAERRKRISTVPNRLDLAAGAGRFYQQGMFFRRRLWDEGLRFNVANRTCWDWELFVDACLAGARVQTRPQVLGHFRLHGASITGSGQNTAAYLQDRERIMGKARAGLRVSGLALGWRRVARKIDFRARLQEFFP